MGENDRNKGASGSRNEWEKRTLPSTDDDDDDDGNARRTHITHIASVAHLQSLLLLLRAPVFAFISILIL